MLWLRTGGCIVAQLLESNKNLGFMRLPLQLFIQEFGEPFLRRRHFPFAIGNSERDQWMLCMNQALSDVVEEEALRVELSIALSKVADHMRNREG